MRRPGLLVFLAIACMGCGLLPGGGGVGALFPTLEFPTPEYPDFGTLEPGAFVMQAMISGTVLDQDGNGVPGAVICYGSGEEDAVEVAETDSGGAYSARPPQSFNRGGGLIWAYLAESRFEPDRVQMPEILVGDLTVDFVAYPSIYPVPPERDCR